MKKSFTLIELVIVLVIIGILTVLALPQYEKMKERAIATEAVRILSTTMREMRFQAEITSVQDAINRRLDFYPDTTTNWTPGFGHPGEYIYFIYQRVDGPYTNYTIALPRTCLRPKEADVAHLDPCCQRAILRLGGCKIYQYSDLINKKPYSKDSICLDYVLDHFSYTGCYMDHFRDENFLDKVWHIYMYKNLIGKEQGTVHLFDQNGLWVGSRDYDCLVCN